ncbi:MAG: hypothetical protein HYX69_10440 [Planctomycetia bacterium]|nr:hypothetical protein [Planctomycetia bacterium]
MSGGQIAVLAKKSSAAQRTRLSTTLEALIRETEQATAEARRRLDHLIRQHNALGALDDARALHETLDDGL